MRMLVDEYLALADAAFRQPPGPWGDSHSLLRNLGTVPVDSWDEVPPGGGRTVRAIVLHVGWAKWMYDSHAFRGGQLRGDTPPAFPADRKQMSPSELMGWLTAAHESLAESVRGLRDEDLERTVRTNWGELWTARRIVTQMIGHDHYHAGEVNHLRALLMHNDRWPY